MSSNPIGWIHLGYSPSLLYYSYFKLVSVSDQLELYCLEPNKGDMYCTATNGSRVLAPFVSYKMISTNFQFIGKL